MTGSTALHLMTVNAWGLPFPAAWWRRGPRFARIRALLASGAHDVVGLQEVWGGARVLLQADDLHWPGAGGDTGLGAHTSHPVIARFEHRFRRAVGMDRLVRKGLLALHLELPAGRVWVLVTHLQAGASAAEMAVRGEQVDELLGVLAGLDGAAVVMGDLNLYEDGADLGAAGRLLDSGLTDVALCLDHPQRTHRWEPARLDRILLRDGGGVALVAEQVGVLDDQACGGELSDHLALAARVGMG